MKKYLNDDKGPKNALNSTLPYISLPAIKENRA
jgi:hypothetical protein